MQKSNPLSCYSAEDPRLKRLEQLAKSSMDTFIGKWESFVHNNPAILRKVDPFYVTLDVFGISLPTALALCHCSIFARWISIPWSRAWIQWIP
jgi:hypothetical protein